MAKETAGTSKKKTTSAKKKAKAKKTTKKSAASKVPEKADELATSTSSHQDFPVKISTSLAKKVKLQAEEEGITAEEYLSELISEGVVLRAWEIIERRSHLRDQNHSSQQRQHHANSRGSNNNRRNDRYSGNRRGSMSNSKYQNIMDDKASFLEYVRNQERQQGR